MAPLWLLLACLDGLALVVVGASTGHGRVTDPYLAGLLDTASDYHAWHAAVLVALSVVLKGFEGAARRFAKGAAVLFVLGTVLFCGSLYAHALRGSAPVPVLTPLGGLCFIGGWLALAVAAVLVWRARVR